MAELAMYVGLTGMLIGLGMMMGPIILQSIGKQLKYSDSYIKIGFIIFIIFIFVTIGGAFGSSELGKSIMKWLSEPV